MDNLSKLLSRADLDEEEYISVEEFLRDRLRDVASADLPHKVALTAAASIMGRCGGSARSLEKTAAARRNGVKGGRPAAVKR